MCSPREERLVRIKLPMQNFESGKFILKHGSLFQISPPGPVPLWSEELYCKGREQDEFSAHRETKVRCFSW